MLGPDAGVYWRELEKLRLFDHVLRIIDEILALWDILLSPDR
jgi:hypothetical protein